MKNLGRASASQVIAAYRDDCVLLRAGKKWPQTPDVSPAALPLERLAVLAQAGRPLFLPLEAAWDLYEMSADELLAVRSMWSDPPYVMTLRELLGQVASGAFVPSPESQQNLEKLRHLVRQGSLSVGQFIIAHADTQDLSTPAHLNQTLCLVDGHHRLLALALESGVPSIVRAFVGSRPVPMEMVVLDGLIER